MGVLAKLNYSVVCEWSFYPEYNVFYRYYCIFFFSFFLPIRIFVHEEDPPVV